MEYVKGLTLLPSHHPAKVTHPNYPNKNTDPIEKVTRIISRMA